MKHRVLWWVRLGRLRAFRVAACAMALVCGAAFQAQAAGGGGAPAERASAAQLQALASEEGGADAPDAEDRLAALPGNIGVLRDLAYGPDPLQRMDVYLPAHAQGAPVLFLVHGGGWRGGDKAGARLVQNKLAHWLRQGVVVVSVNYRLVPQALPDVQAADVARALAWAQQQAATWGADPRRFVLMGHSAGAHLVALLAGDAPALRAAGAQPIAAAVLIDSAAIDVPQLMAERHLRLYDRAFGSDPEGWARLSPREQLRAGAPPLLVVCSSLRSNVCARAQAYAAQDQALGGHAEVLPQALRHSQTNEQLGRPGAYTEAVDRFLARIAGWRAP